MRRGMEIGALIGIVLLLFLCGGLGVVAHRSIPTQGQVVSPRPVVILDAGHGGPDGGAVAPDGTPEKEINLSIARKTRDLLSLSGFDVIMTREDDRSIHDPEVTGIGNQKRSDMYNRLEIITQHPDAVFLSIHLNRFSQSQYHGAQMFYSPNHLDSPVLAQLLQDGFVQNLQPDNQRQIKPAGEELFLLYHAQVPAVLVECGFLSNPQEWENLTDENYQKKIALVILEALLSYENASQNEGLSL